MEPYTSISTKILYKAKHTPYNYNESDITRAKETCEDRLFDAEYAGLHVEVMKWHVQRWLWDSLFPHETDRFPGTKPRGLPDAVGEEKPRALSVKIRKAAIVVKTENPSKKSSDRGLLSSEAPDRCVRCRSRDHREPECTSKVVQERVLECSVFGHGMYIFGMVDGCPKCFEEL